MKNFSIAISGLLLMAPSARAQDTDSAHYRVDWNGGILEATAYGTADLKKVVDQADYKVKASAAARILAQEKLAETIGGVRVVSGYDYKRLMDTRTEVKEVVSATIKDAVEVARDYIQMDDGSLVAVSTLRMRLTGSSSLAAKTFSIPAILEVAQAPAKDASPTAPAEAVARPQGRSTGLIVDLRGLLAFRPGLTVNVLSVGKKVVYGAETVDAKILEKGEMVKYAFSLDDAKAMRERLGASPVVIKAQGVSSEDPGTAIISDDDAVPVLGAEFLKSGRVVFIL